MPPIKDKYGFNDLKVGGPPSDVGAFTPLLSKQASSAAYHRNRLGKEQYVVREHKGRVKIWRVK
jgi:hypothetical protein